MNSRTIILVSSLISKNYHKLIFASKYLFQQVRINKEYLKLVYKNIEFKKINTNTLKYFLDLYRELSNSNHKFSNSIFNKLHNLDYRRNLDITLDIVKDLSEFRLINNFNFDIDKLHREYNKIMKHLVSVNFYDMNETMSRVCKSGFLKLAKILIEELGAEITYENIYECRFTSNIEFIRYIFSKLSRHKIDFQQLILKFLAYPHSRVFRYLMEELKIKIEKSTIEEIFNRHDNSDLMLLINNNYIVADEELFRRAINSRNFQLISCLYYNYNFNISEQDRKDLMQYYCLYECDLLKFLFDINKKND